MPDGTSLRMALAAIREPQAPALVQRGAPETLVYVFTAGILTIVCACV